MQNHSLPLEQFYYFEKSIPNNIYLRQPLQGQWLEMTWKQVGVEARKFAAALKAKNFPPQSSIAILSKNCAHWLIADLGIWMAGHISVPLYPTSSNEAITYVLKHCDAKLLIAGKLDDWKTQQSAVPAELPIVSFPYWKMERTVSWEQFVSGVAPLEGETHREPDEISTIIYTSGTTGNPKGVVHTFKTMSVHVPQAVHTVELGSKDRFFSYLPLSHVAERLLIELGSLYTGGVVSFAETIDSFKQNLKEVRPTIFLAVPRIWLKFQQGILQKVPQWKLNILLSIPVLNQLIRNKIKKELGLDQVHIALTGAAAISKELLEWFARLGIPIQEVYGMTENFCVATFNFPDDTHYGTVGKVWPGTKLKLSPDHEILTWSESNMKGYFKEPALTAAALDSDGWVHTGDLGELEDGFLRITGRVKDLFKTSKGKYVAPTKIESKFEMCEIIEQICVMGDGLPQPVALVVLAEQVKSLERTHLVEKLEQVLTHVNGQIESYERIQKVIVLTESWSVENGLLTPTLKIKRNQIEKRYAGIVQQWSEQSGRVLLV